MTPEQIRKAMEQILLYKKHYYAGEAIVPDVAYDHVEDELRRADPDNPVLDLVGYDEEYELLLEGY